MGDACDGAAARVRPGPPGVRVCWPRGLLESPQQGLSATALVGKPRSPVTLRETVRAAVSGWRGGRGRAVVAGDPEQKVPLWSMKSAGLSPHSTARLLGALSPLAWGWGVQFRGAGGGRRGWELGPSCPALGSALRRVTLSDPFLPHGLPRAPGGKEGSQCPPPPGPSGPNPVPSGPPAARGQPRC